MSNDPDVSTLRNLLELLLQAKESSQLSSNGPKPPSIDALAASISDFHYDPDNNLTFDTWFRRYEDIFRIDLKDQGDDSKVRLLLRKLGAAELDKYSNIILPQNPRDRKFDETIQSLSKCFGDQSSLFNIRYRCLNLLMRESDDFLTHLGLVNRECERFKLRSLTDDQFKCLIFISSLQSSRFTDIRTRLLNKLEQDPTMTLQAIGDEHQRLTNIQRDSALVQSSTSGYSAVQAVHQSSQSSSHAVSSPPQPISKTQTSAPKSKPPYPCRYCGELHFHRECPFRTHRCQRCKRLGHKEDFCKTPDNTTDRQKLTRGSQRQWKTASNSLSICVSQQNPHIAARKYITIQIDGVPVRLQLDTASDISVISASTWNSLGRPTLEPTSQQAISASGDALKFNGQFHCIISFRDCTIPSSCFVSHSSLDLLGLDWIEQFGLSELPIRSICDPIQPAAVNSLSTNQLITQFPNVFRSGLGHCTKVQAQLHLCANHKPVFRPRRPVPYASTELVDTELSRLQQEGVIVPVSYSAWAAPIVVVKKASGSIRICADFSTGLNDALESNQYPLPNPEDLFTILNGGTCFAKLDLADAYLQIEVDPASRQLLTINTHRGLFQYTRLPFGVKTAPAIFQQVMDTTLADVPGVAIYMDDVLIVGTSPEQLQSRIVTVLQRIQDYGFRLRSEKCQFCLSSIKYLGFIFDASGRRPDPENIRAIQDMPAPKDQPNLRSFLGLISYYSAFLPSLHNVRAPLNRLLEKERKWSWDSECASSFTQLKVMLSSELLLTHYDPRLQITVAADASQNGVGAVILHSFPDGSQKAVMHASRTLTKAERNYGQIEKEALALVFAVRRFHKFLFGRKFTLLTDHKPLLAVFGAKSGIPIHSASRLQRWAITLLGYDFSIQYRRSEDFGQADALSRLISNTKIPEEDLVIASLTEQLTVNLLSDAIRALPVTAEEIKRETQKDALLQKAIQFVRTRWPTNIREGPLLALSRRSESLSIIDDCLMFSDRVLIPFSLRFRVLRQLHSGHPGVVRMKALARSHVFWPGIDAQIEDLVRNCSNCQQAAKSPPRQQPAPWPPTTQPWDRVHLDFAGPIDGTTYLVLVDAHSKWPEIIPVSPPTASKTITTLRRIFSQHGLPKSIVSDNGTQFTSALFDEFCRENNISHVRSPPYHPQSNGQAERFVDTFKRALLKSRGEGTTDEIIQRFLLVYRSTPHKALTNQQSPAEILMGRKLRTTLTGLVPTEPPAVPEQTSERSPLSVGSNVWARDHNVNRNPWVRGQIVARRGSVLYEVNVPDGVWVRHRNQLRPTSAIQQSVSPSGSSIPLDILLDTFGFHQLNPPTDTTMNPPAPRRTDRARNPPARLQVNPSQRSYQTSTRGGVG